MTFQKLYDILNKTNSQEGGFAKIYKVKHNSLGNIKALRVLNEDIVDENDQRYKKLIQECKLLLRIGNGGHPNIVRIDAPHLIGKKAFVVMEYIEGEDLNDYILKTCKGFVPIDEFFNFAINISSALAYCHHDIYKFCCNKNIDNDQYEKDIDGNWVMSAVGERNLINKYKVIHNDIHSKNVMRKYDGTYILLDFGLAISFETRNNGIPHNEGVMEYKAPEKWEENCNITEQTDIYSFGILLFEMLTGHVPFSIKHKHLESDINELKRKHKEEPIPSIEESRKQAFLRLFPNKSWEKDYPDWLELMIHKCLEKSKEKRFANAKELYDFLLIHLKDENARKKNLNRENEYEELLLENKSLKNEIERKAVTIKELETEMTRNIVLKNKIEESNKTNTTDITNENEKIKHELFDKINELKESNQELKFLEKKLSDVNKDLNIKKSELDKVNHKLLMLIKNGYKKSYSSVKIIFILFIFGIITFVAGLTNEYWLSQANKETIFFNFGLPSTVNSAKSSTENRQVTNVIYNINNKNFYYTGQTLNGLPNGWGKSTNEIGSYEGTFVNGLRHGYGKLVFSVGGYYEGEFREDLMNGMGTYVFGNNFYYKGEFLNDKLNGKGFYFFPDGSIKNQGTFRNNEFVE